MIEFTADAVAVLRASFLVAALSILLAKSVPVLSSRLLAYGSRAEECQIDHDKTQANQAESRMITTLAGVRVPHGWFASFYVVSTSCSLLWASQIILDGSLFRSIATLTSSQRPSMSLDQVTITWSLMLLQGMRRLYECLSLTKPSAARMWIGHWLFGVWFYVSVSVAVWIEASCTLLNQSHQVQHFIFRAPSLRSFISILIFLLASGVQHDCHAYLASLKKYTLPKHPIFHQLVCPHYFAECLIYLALAVVSAPEGHLVNPTMFCALVLVAVNLGVTADGTRRWYGQKFGIGSVEKRWRMIPFVF